MMVGFDAKHANTHTTQRAAGASAFGADHTVALGVDIALAVSIFVCALGLLVLGGLIVLRISRVLMICLLGILLGVIPVRPHFFRAHTQLA